MNPGTGILEIEYFFIKKNQGLSLAASALAPVVNTPF